MAYDPKSSKLHSLLKKSHYHRIPKGQILQLTGDKMFLHLLSSGFIKRYLITDEGQESIQVTYGPNDIFPLTPVYYEALGLAIYKGDETLYYEAITDVTLYSIGKQQFLDALRSDESLYKDLFYVAGIRLTSNIARLENISLKTSEKRIIDYLLIVARKFGRETHLGIEIELPLSHQSIANNLNIARETVSITISKLQDAGLLSKAGHHIFIVNDLQKLKELR